jgi:hypothetical protein
MHKEKDFLYNVILPKIDKCPVCGKDDFEEIAYIGREEAGLLCLWCLHVTWPKDARETVCEMRSVNRFDILGA